MSETEELSARFLNNVSIAIDVSVAGCLELRYTITQSQTSVVYAPFYLSELTTQLSLKLRSTSVHRIGLYASNHCNVVIHMVYCIIDRRQRRRRLCFDNHFSRPVASGSIWSAITRDRRNNNIAAKHGRASFCFGMGVGPSRCPQRPRASDDMYIRERGRIGENSKQSKYVPVELARRCRSISCTVIYSHTSPSCTPLGLIYSFAWSPVRPDANVCNGIHFSLSPLPYSSTLNDEVVLPQCDRCFGRMWR